MNTPVPPERADFHRAITRRSDRWFAACLKITGERALAEDAVQDALVSAWTKRHQYQQSSTLETWIHRIAINAALQLVRKRRPGAFESLDEDVADQGTRPDDVRELEDLENELRAAFQGLTEIERICFVLKHLEQWRIREIADELDTSIGTVKQAVFRAVRKLRVQMGNLRESAA